MLIPKTTVVTACFHLEKYFDDHQKSNARTIEEMVNLNGDFLLSNKCYMHIYCDIASYPYIFKIRNEKYNLGSLTHYEIMSFEDFWTYQYKDKVIENRKNVNKSSGYDLNKRPWSFYLLAINKFDFMEKALQNNFFNNDNFIWVDFNINKIFIDSRTNNSEYEYLKSRNSNFFIKILKNIPEKFHINIMGVVDKKYLLDDYKQEYYNRYRYIVATGLFSISIKRKEKNLEIIKDLKDNFIRTLNLGYGYTDEMLYPEIIEKHYDDLSKSYGDYPDLIYNYLEMHSNQSYIINYILKSNLNLKYYKECLDICNYFINSIENQNCKIDFDNYFYVLFVKYIASFYYKHEEALNNVKDILFYVENIPEFKIVFDKNKDFYLQQFSYVL